MLQAAHRATVWPTQQCKSVTHRCRRRRHNTSARTINQEPPMRYNSPVDGQRRQSRRDRAPHPSVYSVRSRLFPEAGCRHFSCTDNPIACGQPWQHCVPRLQMQKGTRPLRTDPLKQVIVKPIYSASVSSSFFSEGSGVTSISTPRVSAADFMDREIRRRSRSISMTLT